MLLGVDLRLSKLHIFYIALLFFYFCFFTKKKALCGFAL